MGLGQSRDADQSHSVRTACVIEDLKILFSEDNLRPVDAFECYKDDGTVDTDLMSQYTERCEDEEIASERVLLMLMTGMLEEEEAGMGEEEEGPKRKKRRREKNVIMYTDPADGVRKPMPPTSSNWWNLYVANPNLGNRRFLKKFRRRFRLPYDSYRELVSKVREHELFKRWHGVKEDSLNTPAPLDLLVLCALRYMGRGWTFDDCEESTAISQEVIRVFFHAWIEWGSTTLYSEWVKLPTTLADIADHSHEFSLAGFPGCIGSTDATHVLLERVSYRLRQAHLGFKLAHTARTYNLTVNHRRQILSSTAGHPCRWNDKTLVLFDRFVNSLKDGEFDDATFELYKEDGVGGTRKRKYKGSWLTVDNGYLNWSVTVPPTKTTGSRREIRFSQWLESMRKDVECAFGILKGRWRILKTGIRLHSIASADKIWLTCCALHNMLLHVDGLDEKWEDGVASEWEGELGQFEPTDIPEAIARLRSPDASRNYDLSRQGPGSDVMDDVAESLRAEAAAGVEGGEDELSAEGAAPIAVNTLTMKCFRRRLIHHFEIAFQKGEVTWPRRNPKKK